MNCKKAKILLSSALDGELTEKELELLEQHLASCRACAQEKSELSSLSDTMSLWADEEPSEWLAQSFAYKLAELKSEEQHSAPRRPRWVFGTLSAGLAAAVVALALFVHPGRQVAPLNPSTQTMAKAPDQQKSAPEYSAKVDAPKEQTQTVKQHRETIAANTGAVSIHHRTIRHHARSNHSAIRDNRTLVAYNPTEGQTVHTQRSEPVSEPTRTTDDERVVREQMLALHDVQEDATVLVAQNLGEAGIAMDETLESVRGALRQTTDLLTSDSATRTAATDPNGGNSL